MVHRHHAVTRLCILFYLHMYCIMAIYITYAPMKNKNSLYLSILVPVVHVYNRDSFEHFNRFPCICRRQIRQNIYYIADSLCYIADFYIEKYIVQRYFNNFFFSSLFFFNRKYLRIFKKIFVFDLNK